MLSDAASPPKRKPTDRSPWAFGNPVRSDDRPVSRVSSRSALADRPVTVIFLAPSLPPGSSSLPASRSGPGRSCSLIWPCFRWGLPSRRVTPPLVRSYIKGFRPAPFHPYLLRGQGTGDRGQITKTGFSDPCPLSSDPWRRRYPFCCTVPPVGGSRRGTNRDRGWALPTTAPCEARTFLPRLPGGDRPADRPIESVLYTTGNAV